MAATNWFRKNQKKLLGSLVVFLMVIWGIGPAAEYLVPKPAVGEILGKKITQEQFSDTAARWSRVFFRNANEPVAQQVWRQMALFSQAETMGIYITDEELTQEIHNFLPVDPRIFTDKESYRRMLGTAFHLTEYQFEETIKEYLLARKLQYLLKNSVKITRDEAFQRYIKENEQVKIKYVAFKARDFIDRITVDETEIKSFYDKYRNNFPNAEEGTWGYEEPEKVKLEYVIAKTDEIENQITITEEEMQKYYEDKKELMFRKEPENKTGSETKAEGEDSDGASVSEFQPFDDVKGQIRNNILLKKRDAVINERIAGADNEIYENIDKDEFVSFSKLARKYDLSYVIPTNQKDGTNYFAKDELNAIILGLPQFPQQVFEREVNDPSAPLSSFDGKLIFRVIEKIAPRVPLYEEIRDKVADDLRYEKAFKAAERFAEKCIEKINQTSFEDGIKFIEGEKGKIKVTTTKYINRPGIVAKEDDTEVLEPEKSVISNIAFRLKVGESAIAVQGKGEKTCYVVMPVNKRKVDPDKFEKEKDSIMAQYLMEKQLAFLTEWETWISKKTVLGKSNG